MGSVRIAHKLAKAEGRHSVVGVLRPTCRRSNQVAPISEGGVIWPLNEIRFWRGPSRAPLMIIH